MQHRISISLLWKRFSLLGGFSLHAKRGVGRGETFLHKRDKIEIKIGKAIVVSSFPMHFVFGAGVDKIERFV
jgi:hypothetical protein